MALTLARVSTVDPLGPSPPDPNRDRRGGARGVGPPLLCQSDRPQPDRGAAADVAEAVVGAVAAMVVGPRHEDRPPAIGRLLQVLDRDQLPAPRDRRAGAL